MTNLQKESLRGTHRRSDSEKASASRSTAHLHPIRQAPHQEHKRELEVFLSQPPLMPGPKGSGKLRLFAFRRPLDPSHGLFPIIFRVRPVSLSFLE